MPAITQSVALPPSALWDPQVVSCGLNRCGNTCSTMFRTLPPQLGPGRTERLLSPRNGKKKEGRAGKFSLWVAQYLFLWPSSLCAASWWEVPCPAPSLNTTQDCLAHRSVQVAGRTHRFESSRFLDCNSREDVSLNVSGARYQFFWDVTLCHCIVLKRREPNTQRHRITSCKNLNTSKVKMFDKCLCQTATGCNKIVAKQNCVFKLSIFLSTVNCQYFWAVSTVNISEHCHLSIFLSTVTCQYFWAVNCQYFWARSTVLCIYFIYLSITNTMLRYTMLSVTINALHVSGGYSAHRQELRTV